MEETDDPTSACCGAIFVKVASRDLAKSFLAKLFSLEYATFS